MTDKTKIQWTEATWNPARGCSRVSPGCERCYAEGMSARFSGPGQPYEGLARQTLVAIGKHGRVEPRWTGDVRLVREMLDQPLRWKRPRMIFVNSMSDLFHERLTNEEIAAVFGVMAAVPQHTFQVLTKRAERMRSWFAWVDSAAFAVDACLNAAMNNGTFGSDVMRKLHHKLPSTREKPLFPWPLPNVWLGVSVEDQKRADERIPLLLQTPAAVRFISAEPLLERVDLKRYLEMGGACECEERKHPSGNRCEGKGPDGWIRCNAGTRRLDWVIVGGESGTRARQFDVAWARQLVKQCAAVNAPIFVKQMGAHVRTDGIQMIGEWWPPGMKLIDDGRGGFEVPLKDRKGGDPAEWPEDLRVQEFPA